MDHQSHFAIEIVAMDLKDDSKGMSDKELAVPQEYFRRGVVLLVRFRKEGPPGSDLNGQYLGNYNPHATFRQNPLWRSSTSAWLALQPEKDDNTIWILMRSYYSSESWEIVHYEHVENSDIPGSGRSAQYPAKLSSHGPVHHSQNFPPPEGESWAIVTKEASETENIWDIISITPAYREIAPTAEPVVVD